MKLSKGLENNITSIISKHSLECSPHMELFWEQQKNILLPILKADVITHNLSDSAYRFMQRVYLHTGNYKMYWYYLVKGPLLTTKMFLSPSLVFTKTKYIILLRVSEVCWCYLLWFLTSTVEKLLVSLTLVILLL